tara:strand:- start:13930 stop:15102 length:1173 start_codon:yes stop_codon:yes gene_type:complete
MAIVYISYDGVLEPLGSSQVLNYLKGIASKDQHIFLLSYEKASDLAKKDKVSKLQNMLSKKDITWKFLKYHKEPAILASLFDLLLGFFQIIPILLLKKIKIIHIRGYMPMILGLIAKKVSNGKLIFDTRGFWPDEKADRSNWKRSSRKYKFFKYFEKLCLSQADKVICLTFEAKDIYKKMTKSSDDERFEIIRTCTDTNKFKVNDSVNERSNIINFGYLGSIDTAYDIRKVLIFFDAFIKRREANLHIFTNGSKKKLNSLIENYGLPSQQIYIKNVEFEDVSSALDSIDIGIFFLKLNFSIKASMPTKIGEFFSKGVPIVCNRFNHDIEEIVNDKNGYLLNFESIKLIDLVKIENLIHLSKSEIHEYAKNYFSLKKGIDQYKRIYNELSI